MQAKIKSQIKNEIFEMMFLPSKKTAISCRQIFKYKDEAILIIDQNLINNNNQSQAARQRKEHEQIKIQIHYKAYLITKDFKQ